MVPLRRRFTALLALYVLAIGACDRGPEVIAPATPGPLFAVVPAQGTATTLDVGNWNIEWFGDLNNGPTNESLQQSNARDVISGADLDVWGLEEVVDINAFNNMKAQLPGYGGFLSNDALVSGGSGSYTSTEQKLGILFKSALATLVGAKIILTANDYDFAGRPPLEVTLRVTLNGTTQDIVFIVLHMKAFNDQTSYDRRRNAGIALKSYLDSTYPTQKVYIIGDWNDDTDTSITTGNPSPYKNFVDDSARYRFPTKALSDAGISSSTGYPDFVDHQLETNEVYATYVAGSATAYRVDQYIANYATTTSDHYPVLSRYTFGGGGGTNAPPTASFTSSCSNLSCTFTDGSSDSDGTIASWSWNFGDGTSSAAQNPAHSYAAAGSYTVTLSVTDNGGASSTASNVVSVTATPPAGITITTRGYKVKGIPKVDLTWAGAAGTTIDIYRNNALVINTANDGAHTDTLPKGSSGTFTYRVCTTGTSTCSANSSLTF